MDGGRLGRGTWHIVLLVVLGALFGTVPIAQAKAAATCPAGKIAFPAHLKPGKTQVTVGRALRAGEVCVNLGDNPGSDAKAFARAEVDLRTAATAKVKPAKKIGSLGARVTRVVNQRAGVLSPLAVSASPQARAFPAASGTENGVHYTTGSTHTGTSSGQLGNGTDEFDATASAASGGASVKIKRTTKTTQTVDACPSASGVITGTRIQDVRTTTTTVYPGQGTLVEDIQKRTEVDFTGHVGDQALLQTIDTHRTDDETASVVFTKLGGGAVKAVYDINGVVDIPATVVGADGSPEIESHGTPTGHVLITIDDETKGQKGSVDFDDSAHDAPGHGLAAQESTALLKDAQSNWVIPNACANAALANDAKPAQGGTIHFTALVHAKDGGAVPATLTVTGSCGVAATPSSASSSASPATFTEVDSADAWGTARAPSACLSVKGVSRGGVATATLSLPATDVFMITYAAGMTYAFNRENSGDNAGPYDFKFKEMSSLSWDTTYAAVQVQNPLPAAVASNGVDVLGTTGTDQTQEVDTVGSHVETTDCTPTSAPFEDGSNPPQATLTPVDATGVSLNVTAVDLPELDDTCDDSDSGSSDGDLVFIDSNEGYRSVEDLQNTIPITYAQLAAITASTPLTVHVEEPQAYIDQDCSNPSESLVACTSELSWSGTVTIALAP